jgi:hypothetical protein
LSDGRRQGQPTARNRRPGHDLGQKVHPPVHPETSQRNNMNTIIYIVGLVVIIGFILSYFGFR